MRKVLLALALFCFLPVAASAAPIQVGNTVVLTYGDLHQGTGGEFVMSPVQGSFAPFDTFCVQTGEFVSPNGTSLYRIDGISTATAEWSSKQLDTRTAWLYEQFALGTFSTFGLSYSTSAHAGELQQAIWHFMLEANYLSVSNQFTQYFEGPNGHATPADIGNVRVLNLVNARDGSPAQDQLVRIDQVPEAGSLWLVLTGLAGLGLRMRRRA